jgi:hypothetical protein
MIKERSVRYSYYRTATRTSATNDPDGMQMVVKSLLEAGKARKPVTKAQDKLVAVYAVLICLGPCKIGLRNSQVLLERLQIHPT